MFILDIDLVVVFCFILVFFRLEGWVGCGVGSLCFGSFFKIFELEVYSFC